MYLKLLTLLLLFKLQQDGQKRFCENHAVVRFLLC